MDLFEATDHTAYCPFKSDASYWSGRVGDAVAENAVWSYLEPIESCPSGGTSRSTEIRWTRGF